MSRRIKAILPVLVAVVGGFLLAYLSPWREDESAGPTPILIATQTIAAPAADDPPRIVPWLAIGSARIGSTAARIRRVYGGAVESEKLKLPVGTRYANRDVLRESYRVRGGGTLVVTYVDGLARSFQTDSSRYRTPDGIGVGTTISRGRCQQNSYGNCEYRWRSFQFDECGRAWVDVSDSTSVVIQMNRNLRQHRQGRVASLQFGDTQVVLYCF